VICWQNWQNRYIPKFVTLLRIVRSEAAEKSRQQIQTIRNAIDPLLPDTKRNESLAKKALWVLTSTPGVTCVLNGMRKPEYVDESLTILSWEPTKDYRAILKGISEINHS